jgi:hypothetical protein
MIKKLLASSFLFWSLLSFCQEGTSSPYSYYGIGETRFNGTVESRSMGGISMIPDSTRINFQNPAGYGYLKWTNLAIAGSSDIKQQKSEVTKSETRRTSLDYIAVALPLGRFGAGFGITPLSSVGYKIQSNVPNQVQPSQRFDGYGGVNRVFFGAGFKIFPNLSIGATAYYNFGKIHNYGLQFIPTSQIATRETNVSELTGFSTNVGLMYNFKIAGKVSFYTSLTYTPKSTFASDAARTIGTVTVSPESIFFPVDTFVSQNTISTVSIPQRGSVGIGIGNLKKWIFGGEVLMQKTAIVYNRNNFSNNVTYGRYEKYSIGGYYTPEINSYFSYGKRITYRAGLVYEDTGLIVKATPIIDMAATVGLGFPVSGSLSNLNVGIQVGRKGTTVDNLVQEDYLVLSIGLTLNDKWFIKSKYR